MKILRGISCIALVVYGLSACNADEGPCWLNNGLGGNGSGGGNVLPAGVGGGDAVDPEPQSTDEQAENYCSRTFECVVTWPVGSEQCTTGCTTQYQGNHADSDEAKKRCNVIYGGKATCDKCTTATEGLSDVYTCNGEIYCLKKAGDGDPPSALSCKITNQGVTASTPQEAVDILVRKCKKSSEKDSPGKTWECSGAHVSCVKK